jgi:hypothetical protein
MAQAMGGFPEELKPKTACFTEEDGHRTAILAFDVENASRVSSLAEPWFLNFNAECRFRIAMSPEGLRQAGLERFAGK